MQYINYYTSPIGKIILSADDIGLIGLWFEGQKYADLYLEKEHKEKELPIFNDAKRWIDVYFSGKEPNFKIPLHFRGTPFQKEVWEILCSIPYGKTTTYGEIAETLAKSRGVARMSSQAVGNAVGRNKIGIILPCHRVLGKNGKLTGYAAGIDKKMALLTLEGAKFNN